MRHLERVVRPRARAQFKVGALVSCAAILMPAGAATAQTADEEEIVVTAQQRVERVQDVPISAQVVGAEALAESNVTSLNELSQLTPSLEVTTNGRTNALFIRGVGSGQSQSFDQSVGVFVDGIYHGRSRITAGTFLDLDRIEILRGPQSIHFGNNAIAGALSLATAQPGDSFEAWARALVSPEGENGGQFALEGAMGGPISGTFGVRAAVTYNGQRGWLENFATVENGPIEDDLGGRITFQVTPADYVDIEPPRKHRRLPGLSHAAMAGDA